CFFLRHSGDACVHRSSELGLWPFGLWPPFAQLKAMAKRESWMGSGVLVRWRKEGGFGFIKPSDGSGDLFCHVSQLRQVEGTIKEGDRVRYTVTQDGLSGKRMAGNVVLDLSRGRRSSPSSSRSSSRSRSRQKKSRGKSRKRRKDRSSRDSSKEKEKETDAEEAE
ncbi:unnamed protein product, partial [Effrenium voratum]